MIAKWLHKNKLMVGVVMAGIFVVVYSGCNITNPINNIALVFNTLSISTTASVNFVDAATGKSIASTVDLAFGGQNANDIVTTLDEPLTSTSTQYGVSEFGVSSSVTPTAQNPVSVTLIASASGYQTVTYPVTIPSTGSFSYTIKMIKVSAPPSGVTTAPPTQVQTNSSGQTSTTTTVQTTADPTTGGTAQVTIPSGTTMKDANGNVLTGSLTADVSYISSAQAASSSLLNGLSANVVSQNGSTSSGYIQNASFSTFSISNQSGQVATSFSTPISVSLAVPGDTSGSASYHAPGLKIVSGTTYQIYYYDYLTQAWDFLTAAQAVYDSQLNAIILTFQLQNMPQSYINSVEAYKTKLDFVIAYFKSFILNQCSQTRALNVNIQGDYSAMRLDVIDGGSTVWTTTVTSDTPTVSWQQVNTPLNDVFTVNAYSLLEYPPPLVGSVTIPSPPCGQASSASLPVNQSGNRVDVSVNVTALCPNNNPPDQVKPNGYTIYVVNPGGSYSVGTLTNGHILMHGLLLNTPYEFALLYKNVLYTKDTTITKSSYNIDYTFDDQACAGLH